MPKTLFLHLALVAAGWGIASALSPHLPAARSSVPSGSAVAPSKLPRPELDRPGGQRLLERLSREMNPREPAAPDSWADLSLEEKTDQRIRESPDRDRGPLTPAERGGFRERVIVSDLLSLVCGDDGPDLSYAFRHGRLEAQDIFAQLAARLPEHAATPRFSVILYELLAYEDPRRADTLLDSLPQAEKLAAKEGLFARNSFFETPDTVYELLSTIPWPDDPEGLAARREKWEQCNKMNFSRHPQDYLAWLDALPDGRERDLALSSFRDGIMLRNPDDTPRIRALIDDPVIRESR